MKFYRIKQISDDCFIPQVKLGLFDNWHGLDTNIFERWYSHEYQVQFCATKTIQEARERVAKYKDKMDIKKRFPKYHRAK